jgi:hypothetical protein
MTPRPATAQARPARTRSWRRPRLVGRRTRQLLVFLHVVISVGWLGAGAANVVLAFTAAATTSPEIRRSSYYLINEIDFALVIPLAFGTLASGVLLSLVTKWGLVRYRWVLVKLVLTLVVIGYSTFGVGVWVEVSMQSTAAPSLGASPVADRLAWGATANIVAFLFMTWISFTKPWGLTRRAAPTRPASAAVARPTR